MTRRRKVLIGSGVAFGALVLIGAAVVFAFWDRATPVTADDVAGTLDVSVSGSQPGEPGLYVYETAGFEEIDALGGARHDYPAETYLTIQPGGCGTLVRWQALEQRWTEWNYCEGRELAGWTSFHEWFGVSNTDDWVCTTPAPTSGETGETWASDCTREDARQTTRYEVIGLDTVSIDGEAVETLHVRTTSVTRGETRGESVTEIWTLPGTPLEVQRIVETTSVSGSAIGDVTYHEELTVRLTSLRPAE